MIDLILEKEEIFHQEVVLELGIERRKCSRRKEEEGEKRQTRRREILAV